MARRIYEFNRYLKSKYKYGSNEAYFLDTRAIDFLNEIEQAKLIDFNNNPATLNMKLWDKEVYQKWMDIFRNWIKDNKDEILDRLNTAIFMQDWNKYAQGTISSWEMQALCFYYHEHELKNINMSRYGIVDFTKLNPEPIVEKIFTKGQAKIPIYKLYTICGTCIAKNKTKSIVYLLTTSGVVPVKFRKEYFSLFDRQISKKNPDGKKTIVERSFFNRGNMIMVQGIRRGDDFIAKKYASTKTHTLYHIDKVNKDGTLELRHERYQGEGEEDNDL